MSPSESIEKLIKKLRYQAKAETQERILGNVLQALDTLEMQKPGAVAPNIRRTIMKSPITKLAVAAVIIIAVIVGINHFIGPVNVTSVALADVLERLEQAKTFAYKMTITMTGVMMPGTPAKEKQTEGTIIISNEYGMKMESTTVDANSGEQTIQQMYMIPNDGVMVMVMPGQKKYIRMEFSEDLLARMKKQNNDPRETVKQIMSCDYTELGRSKIDGIEVQGFETTDPRVMAGMAQQVKIKLWVDAATWLPVREELDIRVNEQMQMHGVVYDYQWNIQVDPSEFKPVIPQDYTTILPGGYKLPSGSEEEAIEGLRFCEQLIGRYPKKIDMMNLMNEIVGIKDSNNPTEAALKFKEELKEEMDKLPEEEKAKKIMDIMRPAQALGIFYMMLVQDKKEPVYHGESVGPGDVGLVLLRWKISDNQYRVIFGDLTAADVTAEELSELEKALLK